MRGVLEELNVTHHEPFALSCPNEEGGPIERGIDNNRRIRI